MLTMFTILYVFLNTNIDVFVMDLLPFSKGAMRFCEAVYKHYISCNSIQEYQNRATTLIFCQ